METIYQNGDVTITIENSDPHEAQLKINGIPFIWLSRSEVPDFKKEFMDVLDKYRI